MRRHVKGENIIFMLEMTLLPHKMIRVLVQIGGIQMKVLTWTKIGKKHKCKRNIKRFFPT